MSDTVTESIKSIGHTLSAIFRHLIPGVLVLGASAIARPDWFSNVDIKNGNHLIVLGVLAITVGNLWFILHRYSIQQLIDLAIFFLTQKGKYHAWVAETVCRFYKSDSKHDELKQHIKFRNSSVILMYIFAEVLLASVLCAKGNSLLSQCNIKYSVICASAIIFVAATWQNYIVQMIEQKFIDDHKMQ